MHMYIHMYVYIYIFLTNKSSALVHKIVNLLNSPLNPALLQKIDWFQIADVCVSLLMMERKKDKSKLGCKK